MRFFYYFQSDVSIPSGHAGRRVKIIYNVDKETYYTVIEVIAKDNTKYAYVSRRQVHECIDMADTEGDIGSKNR